jgi:uncharacterized protein (TIGR02246 family)
MMVQHHTTSADVAAIRHLFQRFLAAWGDADTYASVFTEDADYVTFDGTHVKGRGAIAESHRLLFERVLKGSRLYSEPPAIRLLTPDVALIHSKGAVLRAGQQRPSRRRMSVQTLVAIKQADEWRLVAFHNTRYRPFAQTLLGRLLTFTGLVQT